MKKPLIIAEAKIKSPFGYKNTKSWIDLFHLANKHGDMISVHTDPRWGGSPEFISIAKDLTDKPILAKGIHTEEKEIEDLRESLDESKGKTLELEKDTAKMAAHIYVRQKCDGLTEAQKKQVIDLLDGIIVKEDIDRKFDIILESLKVKINEEDDEEEDDDDDDKGDEKTVNAECPECGNKETVKEGDDMKCPECGTKMKADKEEDGKGNAEADKDEKEKDDKVDESKTAFDAWQEVWAGMIKEDK